jgi:hypothetical protein
MASCQVESRYITTSMYIRKNGEQGVRKRVVVYAVQLGDTFYIKKHFDFRALAISRDSYEIFILIHCIANKTIWQKILKR